MDRWPEPCDTVLRSVQHAVDLIAYLRTRWYIHRMIHLPPKKAARVQEEKFLALVRSAYQEIPFYRQRWNEAGVHPDDIRTIADIVKLPVISKEDVREGFRAGLFSQPGEELKYEVFETSGSTGEPLEVMWDRSSMIRAMTYFSPAIVSECSGMRIRSATYIVVMGHRDTIPPFSLDHPHEEPPGRTFSRGSVSFIDALEPPARFLSFIAEKRPDFIGGYTGIITELAAYAQEHGIPVWHPRLIGLSAEPLPAQSVQLISQVFRAPVMASYVATETGLIAVERRYGTGYVVLPWDVVLELLTDDGDPVSGDNVGNVVVTTLSNHAMPLIRYSGLADYSSFTTGSRDDRVTLSAVYGRKVDRLVCRDGNTVNPYQLEVIMASVEGIGRYQIVQHSVNEIEVVYVPLRGAGDRTIVPDMGPAVRAFEQVFGPGTRIRFHAVERIPRPADVHKAPLIVCRA